MNWKKFSVYSILLLMIVIPIIASLVIAQATQPAAGVNNQITDPKWLVDIINFFGLGETWSRFIVSIAVLVMIFAAAYDILAFTAFESRWVKGMIAGGIAVVAAVSRGVTALGALLMALTGGSIVLATFIAIGIAIVFFIIATFFKGRMKAFKYKQDAIEAEGAYALAAAGTAGNVTNAKAALKAAGKRY